MEQIQEQRPMEQIQEQKPSEEFKLRDITFRSSFNKKFQELAPNLKIIKAIKSGQPYMQQGCISISASGHGRQNISEWELIFGEIEQARSCSLICEQTNPKNWDIFLKPLPRIKFSKLLELRISCEFTNIQFLTFLDCEQLENINIFYNHIFSIKTLVKTNWKNLKGLCFQQSLQDRMDLSRFRLDNSAISVFPRIMFRAGSLDTSFVAKLPSKTEFSSQHYNESLYIEEVAELEPCQKPQFLHMTNLYRRRFGQQQWWAKQLLDSIYQRISCGRQKA